MTTKGLLEIIEHLGKAVEIQDKQIARLISVVKKLDKRLSEVEKKV